MAKSGKRNAAVRKPSRAAKKDLWAGLKPCAANYAPLSPVGFLARAAEIFPERVAVIHGESRFTYAKFHERARRD